MTHMWEAISLSHIWHSSSIGLHGFLQTKRQQCTSHVMGKSPWYGVVVTSFRAACCISQLRTIKHLIWVVWRDNANGKETFRLKIGAGKYKRIPHYVYLRKSLKDSLNCIIFLVLSDWCSLFPLCPSKQFNSFVWILIRNG